MKHALFTEQYGPKGYGLQDALLKIHDAAPNRSKRTWGLITKAAEGEMESLAEPNIQLLAGALADAARKRLEVMISSVQSSEAALSRDQAEAAVASTDIGSTLQDIRDVAERAAMDAVSLSKRIDASLAAKAKDREIFNAAKEVQLKKVKEGESVSLLAAVEIAKSRI